MAIFGGRTQNGEISPVDVARIVPARSDTLREEAELIAAASDAMLRRRFGAVWSRDFAIPQDPDKRIGAVQDAIVAQEREQLAELATRTDRILDMSEGERKRSFGIGQLPRQPGERVQAAVDLALRDVEGFESPKVGAERALERARTIRSSLSLDRSEADRFKDISPLARMVWKHVPAMAERLGVTIDRQEGYSPADAEHADVGLSIHNLGTDARSAARSRGGFSQAVNADLDALVGSDGSGGLVGRMASMASERQRRISRQDAPERGPARNLSAAAYLSNMLGR